MTEGIQLTKEQLHDALMALQAEIDDVPERFQSNGAGMLAHMDAQAISLAGQVVHRLMLWELYPGVSPESYLVPADDTPKGEEHPGGTFHEPQARRDA